MQQEGDMMGKTTISVTELYSAIFHGMANNYIGKDDIDGLELDRIMGKYKRFCKDYQDKYGVREISTFKRGEFLMKAVATSCLTEDTITNTKVGVDAAIKVIEEPYKVERGTDVVESLKPINFVVFEGEDEDRHNNRRTMLVHKYLYFGDTDDNYFKDLESIYSEAVESRNRFLTSDKPKVKGRFNRRGIRKQQQK